MEHPVPSSVNLEACLVGGQAFTWWKQDGWHGIVKGTRVRIDPVARRWTSTPPREESFLDEYLGAQRTRPCALREDPLLGPLARELDGLRLLDQDPWEAFLSFLITPVNNVPRIQETIARLCKALGPTVNGGHALPRPRHLAQASEERLRELGLGFRAPRVLSAAKQIHEGRLDLHRLSGQGFERARERLTQLDGVGPKVAECVLCYALGFDEAFPVDRWVARAGQAMLDEEMGPEQARDRWGTRAAMAQQLLFHGARTGRVDGIEESTVARFDGWRDLVGTPGTSRARPS